MTPNPSETRADRNSYALVVVGASAGGVQAIGDLLSSLPADFPVPIAVVQHRSPALKGFLAEVWQARTALKVKDAEGDEKVEPGHVYLAPADRHLLVEHGVFVLAATPKVRYTRPAIDVLFASAASAYAARLIAVILTGGGSDGTDGVTAVKACGGTVVAQDDRTAESPAMPRSAVLTGAVDLILPLAEIGPKLVTLVGASTLAMKPAEPPTQSGGG
jgi:two-component system chemotaxis response regulator CheB